MALNDKPRGVHLVGSIPLQSTEQVFRTMVASLENRLRRLPDGETDNGRLDWVLWQESVFSRHPDMELMPPMNLQFEGVPEPYLGTNRYRVRDGIEPEAVVFTNLGYADAAKRSYAIFARLKREGVIPASVKFQVSLPTATAAARVFIDFGAQYSVGGAYERRLLEEVDEIAAAIPHEELAIQWDVAVEIAGWESVYVPVTQEAKDETIVDLKRAGERVPATVELGYHICYGDSGHVHFKQPSTTSVAVEVINSLVRTVSRPISWVHLPVPRERTDDAYYAPLSDLKIASGTELYLGVVHLTDGVAGTERRIAAAQKFRAGFGVATECGFGRRPAETIPELLRIHAQVAAPVS